jgi:parvulin-like peptidyl-prolyl isomerase
MLSDLAELGCSDTQADDDDDGYLKRNALGPEFDHIHNKCDKGTLSSSLVV